MAGFALIVLGFAGSRHAGRAVVAGVCVAFLVYAITYVFFKIPSYDSDALLFNSYSAQLLLNGVDPYTQSMQPGYRVFGVPEGLTTPTLNGDEVYSLSYPALSFLVYVPFLAFGVSNALWVSVLAHLVTILMLVAIAPPRFKAAAPFVLFLDPTYFDYTVGGVTDVLWLPGGILAAVYWKRNPAAAAAWLGLASCFKQTPWVIIPFALVHWFRIARESRRIDAFATPVLLLAVAFILPNLPFILWHPKAWLAGVLTPVNAHLIVLGIGIAQLATSGLITLSSAAFTELMILSFGAVFALYIIFPRRLAFLPFLAPALVFFFSSRSLHNYFMYWPVVLVAYLFANSHDYYDSNRRKGDPPLANAVVAVLVIVAVAMTAVVSLSSPPTLFVSIGGGTRNAITGRIGKLNISVQNLTQRQLFVHFDVAEQGRAVDVQAWNPRGALAIAAGAKREITLSAPSNVFQLPTDGVTTTQVFAVDSQGQESYSRPVVFAGAAPRIHNGDFAYWSFGRHPFPISWEFQSADWQSGRVAKAVAAGRDALSLRAPPPAARAWSTTLVEQVIDARTSTVEFSMYPDDDYRGDADPSALFGAEIRDIVGHKIYYTIDSRRRAAASYRTSQGVVNVVPGRLHAWNTITVDLFAVQAATGFVLAPDATMVVGAVATVRKGFSGTSSGLFGGVRAVERVTQAAMMLAGEDILVRRRPKPGHFTVATIHYHRFVDDAQTLASQRFTYEGHWEHVRAFGDGRSLGTSSRSFIASSAATLHFDGSTARLYGVRGPTGGRAQIFVDSIKVPQTVTFFSPKKVVNAVVFKTPRLQRGQHRIVIFVAPPSPTTPIQKYVNIDGADVGS